MADEADLGNENADRYIAERIAAATQVKRINPTGFCLYCSERLASNEQIESGLPVDYPRFCDTECRDDWQAEQNILKKQGVI